jgi:hypothetical protein
MKTLPYAKLVSYIKSKNNYLSLTPIGHTDTSWLFDDAELLKSEWLGINNSYTWRNPPERKDSSTYDGCREYELSARNDDIILTLTVWDGDNMWGHRLNQRCSFKFKIPKESPCLNFIRQNINSAIVYKASQLYTKELEDAKNLRVKQLTEQLVGEL